MIRKRSLVLFIVQLAAVLSLGAQGFAQTNGTGVFVTSTALGLQGQQGWSSYSGDDAPEGAYIGWLLQAQTLTGTVHLPKQFAAGRHYVFFFGASYDTNESMQAVIGGGTSASVVMNDRDLTQYWSDRAAVDATTASDTLQVVLARNPSISSDQKFLFRGIYITDNANEIVAADGSVKTNTNTNAAPTANAGAAQTITLPATASIVGTASDDGLPNHTLLTTWSKLSGPGTVTFGNTGALSTTAAFSTSGTYVLRLTASDSALSSTSDVTITVNSGGNAQGTSFFVVSTALGLQDQPGWSVYNGGDAPEGAYLGWLLQAQSLTGTIQLPQQLAAGRYYVFFHGVSYDTNPTMQVSIGGGTSTTVALSDRDANQYWSDRVVVDVATPSSTLQVLLKRNAAISADQKYLFRGIYITSNANEFVASDGSVQIDHAPVVNAGAGQTITLPATATITGTATDDGLPNGTLVTTWSKLSGPGTVTFGNAGALSTTATFSTSGSYVLRLTVSDGALTTTSDVTIIVNPAPLQGAEASFSVMAAALGMQGQANWFFYNGPDAPEGGYFGWLL